MLHSPFFKLHESKETRYLDLRYIDYYVKSHFILQSLGRNTCMTIRMKHNQSNLKFMKQNIHIFMSAIFVFLFFKGKPFYFTSEEELFFSFLYKYDLVVEPVTIEMHVVKIFIPTNFRSKGVL